MKKALLLFTLTLWGVTLMAHPVDQRLAVRVAQNFVAQRVKAIDTSAASVVYTHASPKSGEAAIYAVNVGGAFVLVSADDVAHPVLGYSFSRPWPAAPKRAGSYLPSQVSGYLDDLANQIAAAVQQSLSADADITAEWQELTTFGAPLAPKDVPDSVGPLLTTTWDQGQYYNAMCPEDAYGPDGHVYAGCVATAMAQIINYWRYPVHGRDSYNYPHNAYGTLSVNYDSAMYDYSNMPNILTSANTLQQIQSVAQLIYHCGVSVTMGYGPDSSSATELGIPTALMYYFGYDIHTRYLEKDKFSDTEWDSILHNNLQNNRPVIYCGGSESRHSFICDGYREGGFYHFNFGWNGGCDGWYHLNSVNVSAFDFSNHQTAIVDIMPDTMFSSTNYWTDLVLQEPDGYTLDSVGIIHISSAEGLSWWAKNAINTNDIDHDVVLEADINLSEHLWKPVTWYRGAFNGKGHCIIGLHAIETFPYGAGLFGDYLGHSICNVGFIDAIVTGTYTSGAIAGTLRANQGENMIVQNCFVQNCHVFGKFSSGGIAGQGVSGVHIKNCFVTGACYSIDGAGGLLGVCSADVTNCYTSIRGISALDWCQGWQGMIVKYHNAGFINNCYADNDYVSLNRYPAWEMNGFDYFLGGSNDYSKVHNLFPFTKDDGSARILLNEIDNDNNTDTCTDLLLALNQNVNNINSPELRTWAWDSIHNLPSFGDYYVPVCPNIDSLIVRNIISVGRACAFLSWKEIGAASEWQIKCVPLSDTAEQITYYNSNSPEYIICNLIAGNSYEFFVRPICENESTIRWGNSVILQFDLPYWTDIVTNRPEGYQEDQDGNVLISSAEGLSWLSSCVNGINGQPATTFFGKKITLVNDIDLEGYRWKPIGHHYYYPYHMFMGIFDGNNHTIKNIYCNESVVETMTLNNTCIGLFGSIKNAIIENTIIDSSYAKGDVWVSALVGYAESSTITNCHTSATIIGDEKVGSLCGEAGQYSMITNCSSSGNVLGRSEAGGFVGMLSGSSLLKNCFSTCAFSGDRVSIYAAGLCGHIAQSEIQNVYYAGIVDTGWFGLSCGNILGGIRVSSQISNVYYCDQSITSVRPNMVVSPSEDIIDENGQTIATHVSDTSSFHVNGDELLLDMDILIGAASVTNLVDALNAWVDVYDTAGIYRHWAADTTGENGGFPVFAAIPCVPTIGGDSIAACDSYNWCGNTYTTSTTLIDTLTTLNGCDSIVTHHLIVNYPIHTAVTEVSCDAYAWNGTDYAVSGDYTYSHADANGCLQVDTLHLTVNYAGISRERATACDSYTWKGTTYTQSGEYTFDTLTTAGCDSTITLELTVNHSTSSVFTVRACDEYTWHRYTYTESTDAPTYTMVGSNECDSVVNLHLTINHSSSGVETVTACNSYVWHDREYTESVDTATFYMPNGNAVGCDSTVTLNLTINHCSTTTLTVCDSYTWTSGTGLTYYESGEYVSGDDTLVLTVNHPVHSATTEAACDGYSWNGTDYTISGDYTYSHEDVNGCTQVDTLHLTVNYAGISRERATACDSYTWKGTTYTQSGEYTFDTLTTSGCDSTITLELTVNHSTSSVFTVRACDEYTWHRYTYTESTDEPTYTMVGSNECDSVVNLHLTINHSSSGVETVTACNSYVWHDREYSESTDTATFYMPNGNAVGCDSTVTLHLTVNYAGISRERATACDSYTWKGTTYIQSGEYTFDTLTISGCDSTITLELTVNHSSSSILNVRACDEYTWHRYTYTESTDEPTYTMLGSNECDSVVNLHLTINHSSSGVETVTACNSYVWHDREYSESSDTATFVMENGNAVGCDSTVTLNLTINHCSTTTLTVCDSYTWTSGTGLTYYESGEYVSGDDTLVLTVNHPVHSAMTEAACDGYSWNGTDYTTSGDYTYSHADANGCTQVDTLHLTINQSVHTSATETECDTYSWNGTTFNASGDYTYSHADANGCMQVDTLHLTINHSAETSVSETAENSYTWNGTTYTESGTYTWVGLTAEGCDSTVTLHLTVEASQEGIDEADATAARIYAVGSRIVVDGAEGNPVYLYNAIGQLIKSQRKEEDGVMVIEVPAAGVYMVKVGAYPARKVVVIR